MRWHLIFVYLFIAIITYGQDEVTIDARKHITELTSKKYSGRGYVKNGDRKAADYIANYFRKKNVKTFSKGYFQYFEFPVNTFPGKATLSIDKQDLIPGEDYIFHYACSSVNKEFKLEAFESIEQLGKEAASKIIYIDLTTQNDSIKKIINELVTSSKYSCGGLILLTEKLTWSVATSQMPKPVIYVLKNKFIQGNYININVKANFIDRHKASNVIGYIEGSYNRDSFIVITAHYDHLGMMGKKAIFHGANDNASGVSMLLSLVDYYSVNKPIYNVVFISFAGEEAGLIGSKYYTLNPIFPLKQIKFLINLDLMGTGDEGIMVVNATEYPHAFELLEKNNEKSKLLPAIKKRGKAANSDHYWFSERGVPSFFIYTLGGIKAYHDVYDIEPTLPLTEFADIRKLLIDFISEVTHATY